MEVTSNELRLGNYINAKHIGSDYDIVKVNSITNHSIGWGKGNFAPSHMDIGFFKSIPLTKEILLKCGFVKRNILFINDTIPFVKIVKCGDYFDVIIGNVFYVKLYSFHQLQNLYFALTGQELEINL